jgi:hypothetical protein
MSELFKYRAFISYSRADRAVAVSLQKSLERYVLPKAMELAGDSGTARRPFPRVFRDEDELVPGGDLPARIREGLRASQFLIVVCSEAAAQSEWVEKEIIDFVELGRRDNVLAVVVSGEPNASGRGPDSANEALPRALRFVIADGKITTGSICCA